MLIIAAERASRNNDGALTYGFGELDELVPAYAATIHKSQGSDCKPKIGKYREYSFPSFSSEVVLAFRRFSNAFKIRNAVRKATTAQIAEAQAICLIICRAFVVLSGVKENPELGLTTARVAQGTFGPPFLSCLIVVLRTKGEAPLVQLFKVIAEELEKAEIARKAGLWTNEKGLTEYMRRVIPERRTTILALWSEFWSGITADGGAQ
jgi:hypothetical protein